MQLQRTGFAEDEIRTYLLKKISLVEDEHKEESMLLDARIQSENETARLYLGRFEAITSRAVTGDPINDSASLSISI